MKSGFIPCSGFPSLISLHPRRQARESSCGVTEASSVEAFAEVRRWLPSPTQNALVFRVAVTSSVYPSADPITKSHFTSEAGTYLLPLESSTPFKLAMGWNAFQMLQWLPDASGLLQLGPANSPSVELDWTMDDGQLALVESTLPPSIFWLKLDGCKGTLTDLTAYLGEGKHLTSLTAYVPEIWP